MINTDLDRCQQMLQDDGTLWSRAELLGYYEDGYRHLLAESTASRRFTVLDVPPRFPWSVTHPAERALLNDAPAWLWALQHQGGWGVSVPGEIEVLDSISPTSGAGDAVTHPAERTFLNPAHQHFRFALPREAERVVKIWYDNKLLIPISTRALDATETAWMSLDGEPIAWTLGIGPNRTFEVYEIETAKRDTYLHRDAVTNEPMPLHGSARRFTGSRTYAWQSEDAVPYGIPRRIVSTDRQYYPRSLEHEPTPLGRATWLASSIDALLVLEARIPGNTALTEEDTAALLPPQMHKYLRYYTLFRAFNRQGEGYDGSMAALYEQRFLHGMRFARRIHQLARKDRQVVRTPRQQQRKRPPRVRLPSNYPAVIRQ